jgi:hypothetical protein
MRHLLASVNYFVSLISREIFHFPHLLFTLPPFTFCPLNNCCFRGRFATGGELYQTFRKLGKRFSTNAFIPSFWSSVAKVEWNNLRSNFTPSASGVS